MVQAERSCFGRRRLPRGRGQVRYRPRKARRRCRRTSLRPMSSRWCGPRSKSSCWTGRSGMPIGAPRPPGPPSIGLIVKLQGTTRGRKPRRKRWYVPCRGLFLVSPRRAPNCAPRPPFRRADHIRSPGEEGQGDKARSIAAVRGPEPAPKPPGQRLRLRQPSEEGACQVHGRAATADEGREHLRDPQAAADGRPPRARQ